MSGTHEIDIILPIGANSLFLRDTINSLLLQTYQDFRIIAVIDKGDLPTKDILLELVPKGMLRILEGMPKQGVANKLNLAIALSNAKFIARADADDLYDPDRLKIQRDFLLSNNLEVVIVGSTATVIDEEGKKISRIDVPALNVDISNKLLWKNSMLHPSILAFREVFQNNHYRENLKTSQDYELWLRLATSFNFGNIQKDLLLYRVHRKNSSKNRISWREIFAVHNSRLFFAKSKKKNLLKANFASFIWSIKNVVLAPLFFLKVKLLLKVKK